MKSTTLKTLKGMFTKVAVAGVLAGAVLAVAPVKAEAQSFSIGVGFGHPYGGPVYARPYYGPRGFYEDRRREEIFRHEQWVREHEFRGSRPYGYRR